MRHLAPLLVLLLVAAATIALADRARPASGSRSSFRDRLAFAAFAFGNEFGKVGEADAPTAEQLVERATELRTGLLSTADRLREMRTKPAEERSDNWSVELRGAIDEINLTDTELKAVESELEARHRASMREAEARRGPGAALENPGDGVERRSAGQIVAESEEYRSWVERSHGAGISPDIEVRALLSSESSDPAAGLWMPRGTPFLPDQAVDRRRLFIRDLIAGGTTTLSSIPYVRELTPRTNETGATAVAEGSAKPEVTMQFVGVDAPVRKIAAWIPATTEILEDAPTLRSYIDARLAYMLAVREEEQVLNGNGTSPNIRGIRQTTGLQTQASAGSGEQAATIGLAIAKIENVDGVADGIAMNPVDYWTMLTTRHANQFDDGFGTMVPYVGAPRGLWGLPVVRTRSMETLRVLVGAFQSGAQLFDRSGTVIRVGDQHSDYFTNNKVAILAEERIALAVYRPDWFVEATIAA